MCALKHRNKISTLKKSAHTKEEFLNTHKQNSQPTTRLKEGEKGGKKRREEKEKGREKDWSSFFVFKDNLFILFIFMLCVLVFFSACMSA